MGLGLGAGLAAIASTARAGQARCQGPMKRDYYLYTPAKIDPEKTYWLVAWIHGYKGTGRQASVISRWTRSGDRIVVGPSLPNGYQGLQHRSAQQLIGVRGEISRKIKLHKEMFVIGFSGGAQFAHRFAMYYPDHVVGCAAHSAGTWATGAPWLGPQDKAKGVPFAISCGQRDTGKAFTLAPMNRITWCRQFVQILVKEGFTHKYAFWAGVGHQRTSDVLKLSEECFTLSTTGMAPGDLPRVAGEAKAIRSLVAAERFADAKKRIDALLATLAPKAAGWVIGQAGAKGLAKRRQAYLKSTGDELTAALAERVARAIPRLRASRTPKAAARLKALEAMFGENRKIPNALGG